MADKKPPKARMVGWYDPRQLVPTAVRAAVSTVFGEFADRREAVAASRPLDPSKIDPVHDYSERGRDGLWLDFAADTGDGWDSTYAMARLLAQRDIAVKAGGETLELPRGRILVLGGDQVYPTASREEYKLRFIAPFETAYATLPPEEKWARADAPDLYAIPGNHDWYDGLQSFLGVFCRRRLAGDWVTRRGGQVIGGRCTQQTRSYFALELPQNWWLCGLDIQLAGYIDQPQADFFAHVAAKWMGADGKPADIILCTGAPEWIYARERFPDSFRNLDYLESVLTRPGHRLRLVLTGDTHHYNRYVDDIEEHAAKVGEATHKRQYITAGGGGAFLHPTHHLPKTNEFAIGFMERGQESRSERAFTLATKEGARGRARYPGAARSWLLSLGDLFFALLNPWYTLTLFAAFALYTWMLDAVARGGGAALGETLASPFAVNTGSDIVSPFVVAAAAAWPAVQAALTYLAIVFHGPGPVILAGVALAATIYLADCRTWGARVVLGAAHALAQAVAVIGVTVALARFWPWRWLAEILGVRWDWLGEPLFIVAVAAASAFVAATVMGLYLWLCLSLGGKHWNEAFSALRLNGYKNLLRLHIAPDGTLRVYPIGLRKAPEDRGKTPRDRELKPHLIEGPIVIPGGTTPAAATAPNVEPAAKSAPPPAASASEPW